VNLGELGVVGEVVFFGAAELTVPTGVDEVWLARVVGQALTVTVTTDGTTTGAEVATTG
jgi:hypothetical protein